MKKIILASLMLASLPFLATAQSAGDDLYFIPKKKTVKKEIVVTTPKTVVVNRDKASTQVYASPGSTVVVRDMQGRERDIDEYNRRYTSRDNTFTQDEDGTIYIDEKPYDERGEWVNGFEGSEMDYEYAMRIIRFRNPRFAIPVSSPLYWDVIYTLPSWEWNVFDDGFYAYAFPTYSNPYWWDWRFSYGPTWGGYWGYHRPHFSIGWNPGYWYGAHWGGGYWGCNPWHNHYHYHYHPCYGWGGGYWGGGSYYGSSKLNPGIHAGRYNRDRYHSDYVASGNSSSRGGGVSSGRVSQSRGRNSRDAYLNNGQSIRHSSRGTSTVGRPSSGRVIRGSEGYSSVRPNRKAIRGVNQRGTVSSSRNAYNNNGHSRGNMYTRPIGSTNKRVDSSTNYQRRRAERGEYRSSNGEKRQRSSAYQRSGSQRSYSEYSNSTRSSNSRSSIGRSSNSRSSHSSGISRSSGGSHSRGRR